MFRKVILPLIAICGALLALFIVFVTNRPPKKAPILFPPPNPPFIAYIAGAGAIEASSRDISIGSPFNQIVTDVYVLEGTYVKKNDPLFKLDTRALEASAQLNADRVRSAFITFEEKALLYSYYERLRCKGSVSEQAITQALFALKEAEAQINIASSELNTVKTDIFRSTILSPIDALVLQVTMRPGMVAPTVPLQATESNFFILGSTDPLHMRVDIDQDDIWRFKSGAKAVAYVRGNSSIHFEMEYVRTEPYVIPKATFTGATNERIDTRVLQVLYRFPWGTLPVYVGQVLDIYIEADPLFQEPP